MSKRSQRSMRHPVTTTRFRAVVALAGTLAAAAASAQAPGPDTTAVPRLTVRPHAMAIGTHTSEAGLKTLAGYPGYLLYVPRQCEGTQRSPLIVLLHGGGRSAEMESAKFRGLADKYGVIVLFPNATYPGRWEMSHEAYANSYLTPTGLRVQSMPMHDVRLIDSAMKLVLRTDAIDPNRIALLGFSDGGSSTLLLGRSNQDVFSRVAALSALTPFDGPGPANAATQFLLSGGIAENMVSETLVMARILRHEGHPVVTLLGLRGHEDLVEDEDFIWAWLMHSWADPGITLHPALPADSDPVLTVEILKQMTDFWTRFANEPDSVVHAGRMAHQEQRWMQLGDQPASVIATNMPALAAVYPSVAADLQDAGLTAGQEAAYRRAILRVGFARAGQWPMQEPKANDTLGGNLRAASIAPTSILGRNLAFRASHDDAFAALGKTGIWTTQ